MVLACGLIQPRVVASLRATAYGMSVEQRRHELHSWAMHELEGEAEWLARGTVLSVMTNKPSLVYRMQVRWLMQECRFGLTISQIVNRTGRLHGLTAP